MSRWDPALLAGAEQHLARHVGPIARLLVSKAAAAATNEAELYERLAHAVPDATERADFLRKVAGVSVGSEPAGTPRSASADEFSSAISEDLLNRAGEVLIANLGPGEEILIVDGDVALAKLTSETKLDQTKLKQLAVAEAVDDQANDFARFMT